MKTKIRTSAFAVAACGMLLLAAAPTTSQPIDKSDCKEYQFLYNDGDLDAGLQCPGTTSIARGNAPGDDPTLHAEALSLDCRTIDERGRSEAHVLGPHVVEKFLVITYDGDGKAIRDQSCGARFKAPIPCEKIDLVAVPDDDTHILLAWNTPDATVKIHIHRWNESDAWESRAGYNIPKDSALDTVEDASQPTTYLVQFRDESGRLIAACKAASQPVDPKNTCEDIALEALPDDETHIRLTWNTPAAAASVHIHRWNESDAWESRASYNIPKDSALDTVEDASQPTTYLVQFRDANGRLITMCKAASPAAEPKITCEDVDLTANALDGGNVHLSWTLPDGARGVILLRDGDRLAIITNGTEEHLDETAVIDETYTYTLQVYFPNDPDGERTLRCSVDQTSIPVFGNAIASGLAIGLGVLAYVGTRRRP